MFSIKKFCLYFVLFALLGWFVFVCCCCFFMGAYCCSVWGCFGVVVFWGVFFGGVPLGSLNPVDHVERVLCISGAYDFGNGRGVRCWILGTSSLL